MTRFYSSKLSALALLTLGLSVAGCGKDPRTQITLYVDASAEVQADTITMRVEFFEPGNATLLRRELVPITNWPVTFALVPDTTDEFVAHVYALDATNGVVAEGVAWTSFVPGSTRFYYMFLEPTPCTTQMVAACDNDEVCLNGGVCQPATLTPGNLLPPVPGPGQSPIPCANVTCGTGAACVARNGVGVCECPQGFGGNATVECVNFCGMAGAPNCGANGVCAVDDADETYCECTFPYDGAACEGCATGWVVGGGGVCEAACIGMCGTYERCNDQITVPACECEVGYQVLGANCVWVGMGFNGGGFIDGEFGDETAWTTNQVTIDDNEFGAGNGVAEPQLAGACGTGFVGQTIQMPAYSTAQPFVVEIGIIERGQEFECKSRPMLRVGETLQRFTYVTSMTEPADQIGTACLPVTGYGPNVAAALLVDPEEQRTSASDPSTCSTGGAPTCTPYAVDSIGIRVAAPGECPTPGTITNGDFSMGTTGWTVAQSFNAQAGTAAVTAQGFTISLSKLCQSASVAQTVSFPVASALTNPALRYDFTGSAGETLQVELVSNGHAVQLAQPLGTGGLEVGTVCIPPWLQGTTATLRFRADHASGTCAINRAATYSIDNVAFVDEPGCAVVAGTVLADFEDTSASNRLHVAPQNQTGIEPSVTPRYFTSIEDDSDRRVWALADGGNATVVATILAQIPVDPTGVQGPAVRMIYRVDDAAQGGNVTFDPSTEDMGHVNGTVYGTVLSCINRNVGGQVIPIRMTFRRTGPTPITHYVDDIEVGLIDGC